MTDIIVVTIILAIVIAAAVKIIIEKRKGTRCIGCPYSKTNCGGGCSEKSKEQ